MSRAGTVTMPYLSGRASLTPHYLTASSLAGSKNAYFITGRWNADKSWNLMSLLGASQPAPFPILRLEVETWAQSSAEPLDGLLSLLCWQ